MALTLEQMAVISGKYFLGNESMQTEQYVVLPNGHLGIKTKDKTYDVLDLYGEYAKTKSNNTAALDIIVPEIIRKRINSVSEAFREKMQSVGYDASYCYSYPMKSQHLKPFLSQAINLNANLETASYNELSSLKWLIDRKEINKERLILLNGPKSDEYLQLAVSMISKGYNVVPIIESDNELYRLEELIDNAKLSKPANIGLRLKLSAEVRSHWAKNSVFGVPTSFNGAKDQLMELFSAKLKGSNKMQLYMLHAHIASQIEGLSGIEDYTAKIAQKYAELKKAGASSLSVVDLGGGLAVPYRKGSTLYTVKEYASSIVDKIKSVCDKEGVKVPSIFTESGRYANASSQLTLARAFETKDDLYEDHETGKSEDFRWLRMRMSIINDIPDAFAVAQYFHVIPANGLDVVPNSNYILSGMSCDSDDKYPSNEKDKYVYLPDVDSRGRIKEGMNKGEPLMVAVFDTGAYQDSISGHNGLNHCALPDATKILLENSHVSKFYQYNDYAFANVNRMGFLKTKLAELIKESGLLNN